MKMCCAGTGGWGAWGRAEQGEKTMGEKSQSVCEFGRQQSERAGEKERGTMKGETWRVVREQVWERANEKKLREKKRRRCRETAGTVWL